MNWRVGHKGRDSATRFCCAHLEQRAHRALRISWPPPLTAPARPFLPLPYSGPAASRKGPGAPTAGPVSTHQTNGTDVHQSRCPRHVLFFKTGRNIGSVRRERCGNGTPRAFLAVRVPHLEEWQRILTDGWSSGLAALGFPCCPSRQTQPRSGPLLTTTPSHCLCCAVLVSRHIQALAFCVWSSCALLLRLLLWLPLMLSLLFHVAPSVGPASSPAAAAVSGCRCCCLCCRCSSFCPCCSIC